MGARRRMMLSAAFVERGRRAHTDGITRRLRRWSALNISVIRLLNSLEYRNRFASKLYSKLRKSKLVEPTDASSSSMIIFLECSIPGS